MDSLPAPPDGHALYGFGGSPQKIAHITLGDVNREAGAVVPSTRRASRALELYGSLRDYASRRPRVCRVARGRRAVHHSPNGPRGGGLGGSELWIEDSDVCSDRWLTPQHPGSSGESGNGLPLLEVLADDWGVRSDHCGDKMVWAVCRQ
ncbi:hypothetical protein GCM10010231_63460 [Streptomyces sindenensis]|nr:hypothetical protein GCM10010231_63460 [Streptomyces sindenensis]